MQCFGFAGPQYPVLRTRVRIYRVRDEERYVDTTGDMGASDTGFRHVAEDLVVVVMRGFGHKFRDTHVRFELAKHFPGQDDIYQDRCCHFN